MVVAKDHLGDDFTDDGLGLDDAQVDRAEESSLTRLAPVGVTLRPNGTSYTPRKIGDVEDLAFLRAMRNAKRNVLFYGPPGSGKTALSEAAFAGDAMKADSDEARALMDRASVLGVHVAPSSDEYLHHGFESIVCGSDTIETDFYGTFVPVPSTGIHEFWAGPLLRAVLFDIPIYVDEIFLCDTRVLASALYPLMDGRNVLRISMNPMLPAFPVGKGFFVIGAGNPDAPGANYSEALRSRFAHQIEIGTDWSLARTLKVPNNIITAARHLDALRRNGSLTSSPQLRELIDFREDVKALGETFAAQALLGKTPFEDRDVVADVLKPKFGTVTPLALGGTFRSAASR